MTYFLCEYLWQEIDYHLKSLEIRCKLAVIISHKIYLRSTILSQMNTSG